MTISRKEFVWYAKLLAEIQADAMRLQHKMLWGKPALVADIHRNCDSLRTALEARISKPRPRKQGNAIGALPSDGDHDA